MKFIAGLVGFFMVLLVGIPSDAREKMLQISEKTKFYKISGRNAAEFAISMGRKGPYSFQHRRRAWATAGRSMTYQYIHQKNKNDCRMKNVKVKLKITYTMPKLASTKGISKRELSKWRKMYGLLNKHERTHGLYYRQLARKIQRTVRRMKPAKTCRILTKQADLIIAKLSDQNKLLNQRFDVRDKRNYRRMERLYSGL